jgi:hypothetical protein
MYMLVYFSHREQLRRPTAVAAVATRSKIKGKDDRDGDGDDF